MNVPDYFPIYDVSQSKATGSVEEMGGKLKEWITYSFDGAERRILFKEGRSGTGENWAEKITSELANLIEMPHAIYEFGRLEKDRYCVISPKFIKENEILIPGNQLIEGFDASKKFKNPSYTLDRILSALEKNKVGVPNFDNEKDKNYIKTGRELFIGYLCFDAWIGNTDRHDENWAIIVEVDNKKTLAPTFDHASSLGRNETDENRIKRMKTKDKGFNVNAYVSRAMTPIYDENGKNLSAISIVEACKKHDSVITRFWIKKIINVMNNEKNIKMVLDRVPNHLMSEPAKDFALAMLQQNTKLLQGLEND